MPLALHDEQFGFEIVDAMTGTGECDMEEAQAPAGEALTGPKAVLQKVINGKLKTMAAFKTELGELGEPKSKKDEKHSDMKARLIEAPKSKIQIDVDKARRAAPAPARAAAAAATAATDMSTSVVVGDKPFDVGSSSIAYSCAGRCTVTRGATGFTIDYDDDETQNDEIEDERESGNFAALFDAGKFSWRRTAVAIDAAAEAAAASSQARSRESNAGLEESASAAKERSATRAEQHARQRAFTAASNSKEYDATNAIADGCGGSESEGDVMEDEGGFTIRPTTARTIALAKKPTGEMLADETKVTAMYEGQPYDGIIKGHSMAARTYEAPSDGKMYGA